MTLAKVEDENYTKLGQIYQLCKNHLIVTSENRCMFKKVLSNHFDLNVLNYQLPACSLLCQKKPDSTGNTILHLIVELSSHKIIFDGPCFDILINLGADFTIKNSNGYTPLLLAFNSGRIINSLLVAHTKKKNSTNICCKHGISHFHVACSSDQVDVVNFFLKSGVDINERVNCDSPEFPGFTPLHFSSKYCRVETIELLLRSGADLNVEDAKGVTALHLLIENLFAQKQCSEIRKILQREVQRDVLKLPDNSGLTRLHLDCALANCAYLQSDFYKDAIDSVIKSDSALWPGQTPLHFAAQQPYDVETVLALTEAGADLLAKDATGTTPLDLILKKFHFDVIISILMNESRYRLSELRFTDDIYLLEALQAMNTSYLLQEFLTYQLENVNSYIPLESLLWPGCNLLHLAVLIDKDAYSIIDELISHDVDFAMPNTSGMSPLHLAFRLKNEEITDMILSQHQKLPANPVDRDYLTHLHIACAAADSQVVEFLLKNGADPNLHTQQDFEWTFGDSEPRNLIRKGSTALHFAIKRVEVDLTKMLLSFQADPKATDADGATPFQAFLNMLTSSEYSFDNTQCKKILQLILESYTDQITSVLALKLLNITLSHYPDLFKRLVLVFDRERRFEELGLTRLQVACASDNLSMVKEELQSGAQVNHCINFNSPVWPGDTALHLLFRQNHTDSKYEIAELLLGCGADPTIKNASNQTFMHLNQGFLFCEKNISLLLKNNCTSVNPANNEGLSHLHLCCQTNNTLIIKELLQSGANVNAQVDYFTDNYAGYTPLHFAIQHSHRCIVELLISNGADPNIKAANGLNALHLAVSSPNTGTELVEALLRCPIIDLQAEDIFRKTALETIIELTNRNDKLINLLLDKGAYLDFARFILENSAKSKLIIKTMYMFRNETYKKLINNVPDLTTIDVKGQSIIHHIACQSTVYESTVPTTTYFKALQNIEELLNNDCELDHKDHQGQTPLHRATFSSNHNVVKLLLGLGADVNITDDNGKTPYVYSEKISDHRVGYLFMEHIRKLEFTGIFVDNSNKTCFQKYRLNVNLGSITTEKQRLDVKLSEIHSSFTANYFFRERFVVEYRRLPAHHRQAICNLCKLCDLPSQFPELWPLIIRQCRRARSRSRLLQPAADALQMIANKVIPQLCLDLILSYLNNNDMMNLVRTQNDGLKFGPFPENC